MLESEIQLKWGIAVGTWIKCRLDDVMNSTIPFLNPNGTVFTFENVRVAEVGNSIEEAVYEYRRTHGVVVEPDDNSKELDIKALEFSGVPIRDFPNWVMDGGGVGKQYDSVVEHPDGRKFKIGFNYNH